MKKKIFIGLGILVLSFILWVVYGLFIATPKSPGKTTEFSSNGADFKVVYSQPFKRGRLIFGEEKDAALLVYGKYWRLGANAGTEITFSKNITFGGQAINAGTYRMYAVPNATTWKIVLNSEVDVFFGAPEPDYTLDVLKIEVPVEMASSETEQLTIDFASDSSAISMNVTWDKTLVRVPIIVQ